MTDAPLPPSSRRQAADLQHPTRRRWLGASLGLAGGGLLGLGGCGAASDDSSGSAYLRVMNATQDYSTADFWVGSSKRFSAVANGGTATGYALVGTGDVQLSLHASGSSTAKLSDTRTYDDASYTSMVALGSLAEGMSFKGWSESTTQPSSGQVKLRVLHASAMLSAVDVYLTTCSSSSCTDISLTSLTPQFTLDSLGTLSDFLTLESLSWRIRITPKSTPSTVLYDLSTGVDFASRSVITLVMVPRTTGSSLPEIMALPEKASAVALANSL